MSGRRPNIVVIVADDLGYGDLSCFNGGLSATPTLDQLVATGTCLTQHYSASPVCAPARASLLTGRYPHRTGAIDTLEGRGLDRIALDEVTVADHLRAAGYETGLVGKWHNGAFDPRYHPNARGFDEFAGFSGGWSDYWNWRLDRNGVRAPGDGRHLTDVLTEEAVGFVDRHSAQPFFLMLAYSAPHYPLQARPEDAARFLETGELTVGVANLYGMVQQMDAGIAQVLAALERNGLADDTFVLFTSDNGPQFGGTGDTCIDRFNCGFRGHKLLAYEGGVRLPAVIRWPAGLPTATSIDDLVHFNDWLPTLLSVAGARTRGDGLPIDGVNVLPILRGEAADLPDHRFWQWNRYEPVGACNAAMRDGRWKLVRPSIDAAMEVSQADLAADVMAKYRPDDPDGIDESAFPDRTLPEAPAAELFDLDADPSEQRDLAATEPARVQRMESALSSWFEDVNQDRLRHRHR